MNKLPEHIRRSIKRAIEDSKRGMQLNDGKQRVTLPGGTLEYLMHLIDWDAAPQVAGLPEESVEEDVYYSIAALMKPYVLAECSASENSLPASVFEAFEHLLKFWLKHKQHVAAQPPAGQAQEQPAQAAQAAPQGWREFIEECAKHSGRMVYGNNLAQHAQLLLASQSTAHPAQAQDVCSNCIGTGIEKGVYKNHPCAFCADHPSQSTAAQEMPADESWAVSEGRRLRAKMVMKPEADPEATTQTTIKKNEVAAMLPNGVAVTNVYDAYEEGLKQAKQEMSDAIKKITEDRDIWKADAEYREGILHQFEAQIPALHGLIAEGINAARYRWLRDQAHSVDWSEAWASRGVAYGIKRYCRSTAKQMDDAIDAALSTAQAKEIK